MCGSGWSIIADAVVPVVVVTHVGVVMVMGVVLVVHVVGVRGVVMLETSCTPWLLSCEHAVATTNSAAGGGLSTNSGCPIAAIAAVVVAVDAHVPIQVPRLRKSVDTKKAINSMYNVPGLLFGGLSLF